MRIEGEYTFGAPREVVFDLLQDAEVLAKAMPGATALVEVSPGTYEAQVAVKVGPVSGTYAGHVSVKDERRPEHFILVVEGKGAAGFLKGDGAIDLEEVPEGTLIHYAGETHVGGRIAQVGQRLIQSVARKLISEGLQSLEGQLAAQQALASQDGAPTQVESTS
ncbi:MAG: carbon monoxide dehydrogenase subunit G [Ardenticatenaceae bacterium]|nr:carbon monoxide dehydrogenase subunit G [Ardenticatenaceae bacterium]HBY94583.1 carbon monoxide dehydrogenase [Chloroflexota bacterium]